MVRTSVNRDDRESKATIGQSRIPATLLKRMHSRSGGLAVLALLWGVTFIYGLGRLPFVGPDEPRYAQVGREMLVSGDYITPRICGHNLFEKPVLLYWGEAAAYRLLGINEFAARLPSALAAVACAAVLFWITRSTISSRLAVSVSAILATSGLFIAYARVAVTDMLLTASMCAALSCFYLFTAREGRLRSLLWLGGCGAAGVAVLAKGLVGAFMVAAILVVSYLMTGKPQGVRVRDLALGLVTFIVVVAAWYVPVTLEQGKTFINEFIINQHFRRYLSNRYSHPQPIWFFPVVILAGAIPWTFFFLPAVRTLCRTKIRGAGNAEYLLVLAWIWVLLPVAFFSFSKSKLPGYIVPTLPAVAIILGFEVERIWRARRDRLLSLATWLTIGVLLAMSLGLPVYVARQGISLRPVDTVIILCPFALALVGAGAQIMVRRRALVLSAALVVSGLVVAAAQILVPKLDDQLTQKRLAQEAASALRPGEQIALYMDKKYGVVFYSNGRVIYGEEKGEGLNSFSLDDIAESVRRYGSVIVVTTTAHQQDLLNDKRLVSERIAGQGRHVALRVSTPPESDSKRHSPI